MNFSAHCPRILFLTGHPQQGKSSLLEDLIRIVSSFQRVSGILARGHWENGLRSGFTLVDLKSGQSFPLAKRIPEVPGRMPFAFEPEGIQAGLSALAPNNNADSDLIIVDEVGKLEVKGRGWGPCLGPLLSLKVPAHIWVVRKELVNRVTAIWDITDYTVVRVDQYRALESLISFSLDDRQK